MAEVDLRERTSAPASTVPAPPDDTGALAPRLLAWAAEHGRRDLPWQRDPTPYRVWVSEVMLQQTRVATVIPYYERFMSSFPTVEALAGAGLDEVLHLWTGLGYYARARNLHRAAQAIVGRHGGWLPKDKEVLEQLPGIGRSTAGAILALSCSQQHAILDGNARRVVSRYFGVEGRPGERETEDRLWRLAYACTPAERVAEYTQAIMDLGSGVCTQMQPACDACPLVAGCFARSTDRQRDFPGKRRRRPRLRRYAWALVVVHLDGAVLLEERPPEGLWGGLFSLPMFDSENAATAWCVRELGPCSVATRLPDYEHAFTHFDLTLRPLLVRVEDGARQIERHRWYNVARPARIGLSKPALDLINSVAGKAACIRSGNIGSDRSATDCSISPNRQV